MSTLETIRLLLSEGLTGTQDDIRHALLSKGLTVNQSTISRSLRKLGALRKTTSSGETHYFLSESISKTQKQEPIEDAIKELMLDIRSNGSLIVINTTPGSASLLAHVLDKKKPGGILGTVAGDDTIFVAPSSVENIPSAMSAIRSVLSSA